MKTFGNTFRAAALAAAFLALPAAYAYNEKDDLKFDAFVQMCDTDKDGMVSKAEAMKMIEKMWDKQDKKKMGKLDKKQVEAFLRELTKPTGG